jgi:hypothetical protein
MTLFETTLTILMAGLMTHLGDTHEMKNHVVLVRDVESAEEFAPYALFREDEVQGTPSSTFKHVGEFWVYLFQPGDEVRFSGAVNHSADARATERFRDHVISLRRPLTYLAVNPKVKSKDPHQDHSNVIAKLFYPAGTLDIAAYQPRQSSFPVQGPASGCVPRITKFFSNHANAGSVTMTVAHGDPTKKSSIKLKSGAVIGIVNQAHGVRRAASTSPEKDHFRNYMGILVPDVNPGMMVPDLGGRCTEAPQIKGVTTPAQMMAAYPWPEDSMPRDAAAGTSAMHHANRATLTPWIDFLIDDHPACTNTDYP